MAQKKPEIDEPHARELLSRERKRIESALSDSAHVRKSEQDEVDTATNLEDEGAVIEDETVDAALDEQMRSELEAVERAEKRLEEGSYGLSIESGEPIPAKRLETIPWAERTAEEQERYGG
jgi:DnaK suppressor protein